MTLLPHYEQAGKKILGVLGGMGPLASATFMTRLTLLNPVARDQEHVPSVLWSDPRVPDRTEAILYGGPSPLPMLLHGLETLEAAGAMQIVIPCNTAHLWYDEMAKAAKVPILHIVEAVVTDLRARGIFKGRVGLIATKATLKSHLYQKVLESAGYTCIVPSDDEIDRYCMASIRLVKSNRLFESYHPAAECVKLLQSRGVTAIVLGCTELPLAIDPQIMASSGLLFISSIDALVTAAIRWYNGEASIV